MKILFIQAENNSIDLSRPFHSVIKKANFTSEENAIIDENLAVISEESSSGDKFIELFDDACIREQPDIVIIDPLLSYIGGDISRQDVCSLFLRNKLNPLIKKHQVGVIIIHHTGKPPKDFKSISRNSSLAYLGIGSSELTNWARAVSVIQECEDNPSVYEFVHTKRGMLAASKCTTYIRHAKDGVFWEECPEPAKKAKSEGAVRSKYGYLELEVMPPKKHDKDPTKSEVVAYIKEQLAKHGDPADTGSALKVYEAIRKNNPLIVYDKPYWYGRLYVPDSAIGTESEGQND